MRGDVLMKKLAVHPGIGFGAKFSKKQLEIVSEYMIDSSEVELTNFQQLYVEVEEEKVDDIRQRFEEVGLTTYPVGLYVKSLRTCNFCKGPEEEGMDVAIELNHRIAGKKVPFPLRPAYTGCTNACGEPLIHDIGVVKVGETFSVYLGGKAKGLDAKMGSLYRENLTEDQLYKIVEEIIEVYEKNGKKREHFSKFISRYGVENI